MIWMLAQGIPLPPPSASAMLPSEAPVVAAAQDTGPLILTAPTSNTAYRIHPGVPRDRQRIEVAGYAAAGEPWAELRLVQDGVTLAEATDATRLRAWWVFSPGTHHFWLEGRRTDADPITKSSTALVIVDDFSGNQTAATPSETTPAETN